MHILLLLFLNFVICIFWICVTHVTYHCLQSWDIMVESQFRHGLDYILVFYSNPLLVSNIRYYIGCNETDELSDGNTNNIPCTISNLDLRLNLLQTHWLTIFPFYLRNHRFRLIFGLGIWLEINLFFWRSSSLSLIILFLTFRFFVNLFTLIFIFAVVLIF